MLTMTAINNNNIRSMHSKWTNIPEDLLQYQIYQYLDWQTRIGISRNERKKVHESASVIQRFWRKNRVLDPFVVEEEILGFPALLDNGPEEYYNMLRRWYRLPSTLRLFKRIYLVTYPIEYLSKYPHFMAKKLGNSYPHLKEWITNNNKEKYTRSDVKRFFEECQITTDMLTYTGW